VAITSNKAASSTGATGRFRLETHVTPLIITYNEAPNIARVLAKLTWAQRILVIDSGSTDNTLRILASFPQVKVVTRPFDTFAAQCNFGLHHIETPWVLSLDADYVLSDPLVEELLNLRPSDDTAGYSAPFVYVVHGRPLRGTLYPPRTVLYKTALANYQDEGHGHRVVVRGEIKRVLAPILHDDRKSLSRWFESQRRYACKEADHLLSASRAELKAADRLRLMLWPAPIAVLLSTLFAKGCLFDGWRGWHYACQRLLAETMLALELLERRLGGDRPGQTDR
jgi:glycosyltransferase involved in cell wall biosynthesis